MDQYRSEVSDWRLIMIRWSGLRQRFVSATLIASLVTGSYSSVSLAAPIACSAAADVAPAALRTEAPPSEDRDQSKNPDVSAKASRLARLSASITHIVQKIRGRAQTWDESKYEAYLAEVNAKVAGSDYLNFDDYRTPEALLAVWDVAVEQAQSKSFLIDGHFSFAAMMRNASPTAQRVILQKLNALVAKSYHGYDGWRAEDSLVEVFMMSKDPFNAFDILRFKKGERDVIRETLKTRLQIQLLRGSYGKLNESLGLGRPEDPTRDSFNKFRVGLNKYKTALFYAGTALVIPASLSVALKHSLMSPGTFFGAAESFAMASPVPSVLKSRKEMTPEESTRVEDSQNFDELSDAIPLRDKVRVAVEVNLQVAQWIVMRLMMVAFFYSIAANMWDYMSPSLRSEHRDLVYMFESPFVIFKSTKELDDQVYKKWHDNMIGLKQNLDQSPEMIAQERAAIRATTKAQLSDIVSGKENTDDIKGGVTTKNMPAAAVDQNADGSSADGGVYLPMSS